MATAAFKSTTRRMGSQENNNNSSSFKGSGSPKGRPAGGHRRSRSLSRFGRYAPEDSTSTVSSAMRRVEVPRGEEGADKLHVTFSPGPFVNTVRGSSAMPEAAMDRGRRGRSVSRYQTESTSASDSHSETDKLHRRGRSASRNAPPPENINGRPRQRSVSVARYHLSDSSESDLDPAYNRTAYNRLRNLTTVDGPRDVSERSRGADIFTPRRGLRRCSSQMELSRCRDDYSSHGSSSLTDDEGQDFTHSDHGEEKTIRAVYAQMKSMRSDHPTGEMDAVDILEAMRSEVRHAIAELRSELKQTSAKNSTPSSPKSSIDLLEPKSNGDRKNYTTKMEQSGKRTKDLRTRLAVEERRNQELAKILEDIIAGSKPSQTQKPLRRRRNSADRKQMSTSLNEEAQKYIDEFLSTSNLDDSEFSSSFEEEQQRPLANGRKTEESGKCQELLSQVANTESAKCSNSVQNNPLLIENDGVVLPWLQWETKPDQPRISKADLEAVMIEKNAQQKHQFSKADLEALLVEKNAQQKYPEEVGSDGSDTIFETTIPLTSSNYSSGSWTPESNYQRNVSKTDSIIANSPNLSSTGESRIDNHSSNLTGPMKSMHDNGRFSKSIYQDDEYILHVNNEAILMEKMKLESRIESGVILCCTRLL